MSSEVYYKVVLLNWEKHNPKHKCDFKKTMISNNFCTDSKLSGLSPSSHLLYLSLILERSSTDEREMIISRTSLQRYMKARRSTDEGLIDLKQLQLLTFEKITPFLRKEGREVTEVKLLTSPSVKILHSSSANYNARFSSDAELWKSTFGKNFYFLNHHLAVVKDRFDSVQEFQEFCNDVINSQPKDKIEEKKVIGYVVGALKKELGLK